MFLSLQLVVILSTALLAQAAGEIINSDRNDDEPFISTELDDHITTGLYKAEKQIDSEEARQVDNVIAIAFQSDTESQESKNVNDKAHTGMQIDSNELREVEHIVNAAHANVQAHEEGNVDRLLTTSHTDVLADSDEAKNVDHTAAGVSTDLPIDSNEAREVEHVVVASHTGEQSGSVETSDKKATYTTSVENYTDKQFSVEHEDTPLNEPQIDTKTDSVETRDKKAMYTASVETDTDKQFSVEHEDTPLNEPQIDTKTDSVETRDKKGMYTAFVETDTDKQFSVEHEDTPLNEPQIDTKTESVETRDKKAMYTASVETDTDKQFSVEHEDTALMQNLLSDLVIKKHAPDMRNIIFTQNNDMKTSTSNKTPRTFKRRNKDGYIYSDSFETIDSMEEVNHAKFVDSFKNNSQNNSVTLNREETMEAIHPTSSNLPTKTYATPKTIDSNTKHNIKVTNNYIGTTAEYEDFYDENKFDYEGEMFDKLQVKPKNKSTNKKERQRPEKTEYIIPEMLPPVILTKQNNGSKSVTFKYAVPVLNTNQPNTQPRLQNKTTEVIQDKMKYSNVLKKYQTDTKSIPRKFDISVADINQPDIQWVYNDQNTTRQSKNITRVVQNQTEYPTILTKYEMDSKPVLHKYDISVESIQKPDVLSLYTEQKPFLQSKHISRGTEKLSEYPKIMTNLKTDSNPAPLTYDISVAGIKKPNAQWIYTDEKSPSQIKYTTEVTQKTVRYPHIESNWKLHVKPVEKYVPQMQDIKARSSAVQSQYKFTGDFPKAKVNLETSTKTSYVLSSKNSSVSKIKPVFSEMTTTENAKTPPKVHDVKIKNNSLFQSNSAAKNVTLIHNKVEEIVGQIIPVPKTTVSPTISNGKAISNNNQKYFRVHHFRKILPTSDDQDIKIYTDELVTSQSSTTRKAKSKSYNLSQFAVIPLSKVPTELPKTTAKVEIVGKTITKQTKQKISLPAGRRQYYSKVIYNKNAPSNVSEMLSLRQALLNATLKALQTQPWDELKKIVNKNILIEEAIQILFDKTFHQSNSTMNNINNTTVVQNANILHLKKWNLVNASLDKHSESQNRHLFNDSTYEEVYSKAKNMVYDFLSTLFTNSFLNETLIRIVSSPRSNETYEDFIETIIDNHLKTKAVNNSDFYHTVNERKNDSLAYKNQEKDIPSFQNGVEHFDSSEKTSPHPLSSYQVLQEENTGITKGGFLIRNKMRYSETKTEFSTLSTMFDIGNKTEVSTAAYTGVLPVKSISKEGFNYQTKNPATYVLTMGFKEKSTALPQSDKSTISKKIKTTDDQKQLVRTSHKNIVSMMPKITDQAIADSTDVDVDEDFKTSTKINKTARLSLQVAKLEENINSREHGTPYNLQHKNISEVRVAEDKANAMHSKYLTDYTVVKSFSKLEDKPDDSKVLNSTTGNTKGLVKYVIDSDRRIPCKRKHEKGNKFTVLLYPDAQKQPITANANLPASSKTSETICEIVLKDENDKSKPPPGIITFPHVDFVSNTNILVANDLTSDKNQATESDSNKKPAVEELSNKIWRINSVHSSSANKTRSRQVLDIVIKNPFHVKTTEKAIVKNAIKRVGFNFSLPSKERLKEVTIKPKSTIFMPENKLKEKYLVMDTMGYDPKLIKSKTMNSTTLNEEISTPNKHKHPLSFPNTTLNINHTNEIFRIFKVLHNVSALLTSVYEILPGYNLIKSNVAEITHKPREDNQSKLLKNWSDIMDTKNKDVTTETVLGKNNVQGMQDQQILNVLHNVSNLLVSIHNKIPVHGLIKASEKTTIHVPHYDVFSEPVTGVSEIFTSKRPNKASAENSENVIQQNNTNDHKTGKVTIETFDEMQIFEELQNVSDILASIHGKIPEIYIMKSTLKPKMLKLDDNIHTETPVYHSAIIFDKNLQKQTSIPVNITRAVTPSNATTFLQSGTHINIISNENPVPASHDSDSFFEGNTNEEHIRNIPDIERLHTEIIYEHIKEKLETDANSSNKGNNYKVHMSRKLGAEKLHHETVTENDRNEVIGDNIFSTDVSNEVKSLKNEIPKILYSPDVSKLAHDNSPIVMAPKDTAVNFKTIWMEQGVTDKATDIDIAIKNLSLDTKTVPETILGNTSITTHQDYTTNDFDAFFRNITAMQFTEDIILPENYDEKVGNKILRPKAPLKAHFDSLVNKLVFNKISDSSKNHVQSHVDILSKLAEKDDVETALRRISLGDEHKLSPIENELLRNILLKLRGNPHEQSLVSESVNTSLPKVSEDTLEKELLNQQNHKSMIIAANYYDLEQIIRKLIQNATVNAQVTSTNNRSNNQEFKSMTQVSDDKFRTELRNQHYKPMTITPAKYHDFVQTLRNILQNANTDTQITPTSNQTNKHKYEYLFKSTTRAPVDYNELKRDIQKILLDASVDTRFGANERRNKQSNPQYYEYVTSSTTETPANYYDLKRLINLISSRARRPNNLGNTTAKHKQIPNELFDEIIDLTPVTKLGYKVSSLVPIGVTPKQSQQVPNDYWRKLVLCLKKASLKENQYTDCIKQNNIPIAQTVAPVATVRMPTTLSYSHVINEIKREIEMLKTQTKSLGTHNLLKHKYNLLPVPRELEMKRDVSPQPHILEIQEMSITTTKTPIVASASSVLEIIRTQHQNKFCMKKHQEMGPEIAVKNKTKSEKLLQHAKNVTLKTSLRWNRLAAVVSNISEQFPEPNTSTVEEKQTAAATSAIPEENITPNTKREDYTAPVEEYSTHEQETPISTTYEEYIIATMRTDQRSTMSTLQFFEPPPIQKNLGNNFPVTPPYENPIKKIAIPGLSHPRHFTSVYWKESSLDGTAMLKPRESSFDTTAMPNPVDATIITNPIEFHKDITPVTQPITAETNEIPKGEENENELEENDTCGIENSRRNTFSIERYPWHGVITYPKDKTHAVSSVILVTHELVIASAVDIDKLPKEEFRRKAKVVLGRNCTGLRIGVINYNYHPDFRRGLVNTLALVQIDTRLIFRRLRPICAPPTNVVLGARFLAMAMPKECMSSKIMIYEMEHVPLGACKYFYRQHIQEIGYQWPQHFACGRAMHGRSCVWRSGTSLVLKQHEKWHLLGFGLEGPGCGAPSRFIDYGVYLLWVQNTLKNIGQPAISRIAPNHIILRRAQTEMQRYGPCDPEEQKQRLFFDITDLKLPNDNNEEYFGKAQYNLTIFRDVAYSCIDLNAYNVRGEPEPPQMDLQPCYSDPPEGSLPSRMMNFCLTILFKTAIKYKILAYGNPRVVKETKKYKRTQYEKQLTETPITNDNFITNVPHRYKFSKSLSKLKRGHTNIYNVKLRDNAEGRVVRKRKYEKKVHDKFYSNEVDYRPRLVTNVNQNLNSYDAVMSR